MPDSLRTEGPMFLVVVVGMLNIFEVLLAMLRQETSLANTAEGSQGTCSTKVLVKVFFLQFSSLTFFEAQVQPGGAFLSAWRRSPA